MIAPSILWTERYEALRSQAINGAHNGSGWGLALAARQGLAAWMRVWPLDPLPAPASAVRVANSPPADLRGQITLIMADMVLTHQQEITA
jgi:hypothetical protein